jgi:hypothetical protein
MLMQATLFGVGIAQVEVFPKGSASSCIPFTFLRCEYFIQKQVDFGFLLIF